MNKQVVKDIGRLKMLAKAKLINFCNQTGTKIHGLHSSKLFTCYYIDDATGSSSFEFRGVKYVVEYVDGCFYPFVFTVTNNS